MMIYMLAAGMTVTMLIATAFGLHEEAAKARVKKAARHIKGFGPY